MQSRLTVRIAVTVIALIMAVSTFVYACGPDPPPPIWLRIVADGDEVSGTVEIQANIEHKEGLESVDFLVDGESIVVVTAEPFTAKWDTTKVKDGEHKLQLKGTWADGTTKTSKVVTVIVNNEEAKTT